MKPSKLLLIAFALISFGCTTPTQNSRIEVVQSSIEQEATSIWRTINDISFFEKQGYTVHLPKDALIDSLIVKSKNGKFGNEDYPAIYTLVETKLFDPKNYEQAKRKVEEQMDLINGFIAEIDAMRNQWDWDFKMFATYKVVFTLYGTGGSYDPDNGVITMLTNKEGGFMSYQNPANTIIHEIAHMGMEYTLVRKYKLSHASKERLVDTFVYLMFRKKLPEYQIQNLGDDTIDKYVNKKKDIKSLDAILSEFAKEQK